MNPIEDVFITIMFSCGKTVAFETKLKYLPKIRRAKENSGKPDEYKLTPINNFIPPDKVGGPEIFVCMYDVVLISSVSMADVQKMQQKAESGILVPTMQQKPQTIKLKG